MFDWIVGLVTTGGYLAVLGLTFAENAFPPIPSELVLPLAGFAAARGELGLALVVAAATVGSLAGAALWYALGRWLGHDRLCRFAEKHGRWLTLSPAQFEAARARFDRHRGAAVFFGRLIPGARTLISVPAGVDGMPVVPFLAYSLAGTLLWTLLLCGAGYLLQGQYDRVQKVLNPASNAIVGGLVAWYVWRVATFKPERKDR